MMRLADKVQEWLDAMEWEDEITRDEEEQTSQMTTGYSIKEQGFDLYVETDEKRDWIKLYLYAPIKVTEKKREECVILFNYINVHFSVGSLHFLPNGRIRFRHVVDVENTDPSIELINNMLRSAASIFEDWLEEVSAVAMTKMTAQQVIDDLEKGQEAAQEEDVPDVI
jgi:hypothetical protein